MTTITAANAAISLREIGKVAKMDTCPSEALDQPEMAKHHERIILPCFNIFDPNVVTPRLSWRRMPEAGCEHRPSLSAPTEWISDRGGRRGWGRCGRRAK